MPPADPLTLPNRPPASQVLPRVTRAVWDYFAMAGGLFYWGIAGSIITILFCPLRFILPKARGRKFGRQVLHGLFSGFVKYLRWSDLVRADLSALDRFEKIPGGFIVAPNHTSLWDVVFIVAKLPAAVCVMKESILNNFILGGGARLAGYIPNGSIRGMIRESTAALSEGGQLLLFPEGTRTSPDVRWTNPLKGGCAIICGRAGVPIYPLFIRSDSRFLQKGWPLWKRPHFPILLRIDPGEPIFPVVGQSAQDLTRRLQDAFEQELSKPHTLRRQIASSSLIKTS